MIKLIVVKKIKKLANLISASDRKERLRVLFEIRLNKLIYGHKPSDAMNLNSFLVRTSETCFPNLAAKISEAEDAAIWVYSNFENVAKNKPNLPFPNHYNADNSFSLICYALTRYLKPAVVLETGVSYGITSAIVLLALDRNNCGQLISIDLPPLSDPLGEYTGFGIPEHLRKNWILHFGSTRQLLPKVEKKTTNMGLFISDSANIYTLQRYEFESVWRVLASGSVMIFNNISRKLQRYLNSVEKAKFYSVWQTEKPLCVTGILLKK